MRRLLIPVALVAVVGVSAFFVWQFETGIGGAQWTTRANSAGVEQEHSGSVTNVEIKDHQAQQFFTGPAMAVVTSNLSERVQKLPYSATERAMLTKGMVNETAIRALQSKHFDRLLTQFEKEQHGMTAELTTAYRGELEKSLAQVPAPKQIDRLVCGTEICIASIRSPSKDWYGTWFDSAQSQSALPMNTLTGKTIDLGGSGVEYRLLFSTSDTVKGFTGSMSRS